MVVNKATISEVLSEQFLKTKAIKPITKVGQHKPVEIGIGWELRNCSVSPVQCIR